MKIGIYTGSFSPFHKGHKNILEKALKVFDKIYVAQLINPKKRANRREQTLKYKNVQVIYYDGLLVDLIKELNENKIVCHAVIRGLRNSEDLKQETEMLYYNEDLGLKIPVVYFIADRKYKHISGTSLREIEKIKRKQK